MKTYLHKLPEGFIITSGEKTLSQNGDKYLGHPDYNKVLTWNMKGMHEGKAVWISKVIAQEPNIIFSSLKPEEQKEIGWFDVAKLANEQFDLDTKQIPHPTTLWYDSQNAHFNSFVKGFQKAQELLSDKVCTLKDLESIFLFGKQHGLTVAGCIKNGHDIPNTKENMNEVIQALYQNSWEVEIEMTDDKVKILRIL
jgi:hypothetical protein